MSETASIENVVEDYKKTVLIDYVNKICIPIENYRQGLLAEEKQMLMQQSDFFRSLKKSKIQMRLFDQIGWKK